MSTKEFSIEEKRKAYSYLREMAAKRGKTLEEFIDTDVRQILETAWKIQQRTGKPVPLKELIKELKKHE